MINFFKFHVGVMCIAIMTSVNAGMKVYATKKLDEACCELDHQDETCALMIEMETELVNKRLKALQSSFDNNVIKHRTKHYDGRNAINAKKERLGKLLES